MQINNTWINILFWWNNTVHKYTTTKLNQEDPSNDDEKVSYFQLEAIGASPSVLNQSQLSKEILFKLGKDRDKNSRLIFLEEYNFDKSWNLRDNLKLITMQGFGKLLNIP